MESKSAILFRHWIKANPQFTGSYEIKDSLGKKYLPFNSVSQAQLDYAMAIHSNKGVFIRVQAVSEGMPDYVYLRNCPAWIVIKYPKSFEIISIDSFILEKSRSKEKSLSWERAKAISTISV